MVAGVRDILDATALPCLVDADDGYGDVKSVVNTIEAYERIGAAGALLEDQLRTGKQPGANAARGVAPIEVIEQKLRAAMAARRDAISSSSAAPTPPAPRGWTRRCGAASGFLRLGADGVFVAGLRKPEEFARVGAAFKGSWNAAVMFEGGRTPWMPPSELHGMGFTQVSYPIASFFASPHPRAGAAAARRAGGGRRSRPRRRRGGAGVPGSRGRGEAAPLGRDRAEVSLSPNAARLKPLLQRHHRTVKKNNQRARNIREESCTPFSAARSRLSPSRRCCPRARRAPRRSSSATTASPPTACPTPSRWRKASSRRKAPTSPAVLSSAGGGTTVRNLLTGNLAYGEVDLAGTVAAIQQGADLKIISDNVLTVAEFVWRRSRTRRSRPSRSSGQEDRLHQPALHQPGARCAAAEAAGLKPDEAELVKNRGFGEAVVALNLGSIDISAIRRSRLVERTRRKLRVVVAASDVAAAALQRHRRHHGSRRGIAGRFHPRDPARPAQGRRVQVLQHRRGVAIVAKAYNIEPDVATSAIHNLVAKSKSGVPYWGAGNFDFAA